MAGELSCSFFPGGNSRLGCRLPCFRVPVMNFRVSHCKLAIWLLSSSVLRSSVETLLTGCSTLEKKEDTRGTGMTNLELLVLTPTHLNYALETVVLLFAPALRKRSDHK